MRAKRIRNRRENEKGQSLVEFALVVPMLLLLVIGIAEFGRAWMTQNILTGAAREAARVYAVKNDTTAAKARADTVLISGNLDLAKCTINNIILASPDPDRTLGYQIEYDFPISIAGFIPGLSSTSITLRTKTTMRREWDS